jgi:hypothetical protein
MNFFSFRGLCAQCGLSYGNHQWKAGDEIKLVTNSLDKTLHFFVNDRLQPISYQVYLFFPLFLPSLLFLGYSIPLPLYSFF